MAAPVDMAQLEATMADFLKPDNAVRKAAEARLKKMLRKPSAAGLLLQACTGSAFPQARQMAALFMRKKINSYWIRLSDAQKTVTKQTILDRLAAEPERAIRRALCSLAAALAKQLVPANQWPELFAFITQCMQPTSTAAHRELGMLLLRDLLEIVGNHLKSAFESLRQMMLAALSDSEERVRYAALRAISLVMTMLSGSEEVLKFQPLVPHMFTVIQQAVATAHDDVVTSALDAVAEIAESSVPMLAPYTSQVFAFLLGLLMNQDADVGVVDCAGQVVINLVTTRPKAMIKARVVPQIMSTALQMAMDYDEEEHADLHSSGTAAFHTGSSGPASRSGVAERILDKLAIAIPSQHMLPALMESVMPALTHEQWKVRRAALVALAMVAEGCVEPMRAALDRLLPMLLPRLKDDHAICRAAACWTLGQWSQHLKPDILGFHGTILPAVFGVLSDANNEVQNTACFVLEGFCENMTPSDVLRYLDSLMANLGRLITSPNVNVREMAVSAIGSVVISSGPHFHKFFQSTMAVMLAFMQLTDDASMCLRARATDCVGYIATAVGREMFTPQLATVTHHAIQGLALNHAELTEYTFMFFSNMAKLLKADFEPFLERLVPVLMDCVRSNDGVAYNAEETDALGEMIDDFDDDDDDEDGEYAAEGALGDANSDDLDDDEYNAPNVGQVVRVRTAMLDMKSAAALTLGTIAQYTGASFGPYIADATNLLLDKTNYFHEELRQNCWSSVCWLVVAALEALPPTPPSASNPMYVLHHDVEHMMDHVINARMISSMHMDDDREVVARCCECLIEWMKRVGAAAVYKHLEELNKVLVSLLKEQTVCQRYEPDQDDDDDDAAEHDMVLIDTVSDVIAELCKALGASFEPYVRPMIKPLLKFCRPSRPLSDRSMAVGLFAEIAEGIGACIAPHLSVLWPPVIAAMRDSNMKMQRNGAFACGWLLSRAGAAAAGPCMGDALAALQTLITTPTVLPVVKDNAKGALARIMTAYHSTLPLDKLVPVLVGSLPLQEDHEEDRPVYLGLIALLAARKPAAVAMVPQLTGHFAKALVASSGVPEDVKGHVVTCLRGLASSYGDHMGTVFASLPAEAQAAVTAALSGAGASPGAASPAAPPTPPTR